MTFACIHGVGDVCEACDLEHEGPPEALAAGDVVRLASSGDVMTIEAVRNGRADVVWFAGTTLRRGSFAVTRLTAAKGVA